MDYVINDTVFSPATRKHNKLGKMKKNSIILDILIIVIVLDCIINVLVFISVTIMYLDKNKEETSKPQILIFNNRDDH